MATYIPLKAEYAEQINAGLASGSLVPWRIDAAGVQWFSSLPEIRGVPKQDGALDNADILIDGDDGDDPLDGLDDMLDELDAMHASDDDEIEFYSEDDGDA